MSITKTGEEKVACKATKLCADQWLIKGKYCATPEELICQRETLDEIMTVLALCTEKQRERFLLHALYDLSYEEVGKLCRCSKGTVQTSIIAVKKKFQKFWK